MDNHQKKELIIFFMALVVIAAIFIFGVRYLNNNGILAINEGTNGSNALLADIGNNVPAIPIPIPTSTVVTADIITNVTSTASVTSTPTIPTKSTPIIVTPPPKTLPYSAESFNIADWFNNWGRVSVINGILNFGGSTSTPGGEPLLIGSQGWTNYNINANVDWLSGETFAVVVREKDVNDLTYCDFGNGEATIIEKVDGGNTVLGSSYSPNGGAGASYEFGVMVYGNEVACTFNGREIVAAAMQTGAPTAGGIGFIAWDPVTGAANINLRDISVTKLAINNIAFPFSTAAPPPPPAPAPAPVATSTPAPTPTPTPQPTPTQRPKQKPTPVALTLPYTETNFATDTNWFATWGSFAIDPSTDALDVASTSKTSGAVVILKNSAGWSNYTFNASVDWVKGQTFGLIGQYLNSRNFVACEYDQLDNGDLQVQLQQTVNGQNNILVTGYISNYYPTPGAFVEASIKIQGTTGVCVLDGHLVTNQTPNASVINQPFIGGIGFTIWDPANNNAEVVVNNVSVTPN